MRSLAVAALCLAAAGCAAGPHPWSRTNLCEAEKDKGEPAGAATWAALLLRGWDPASGRATSPAVDCTGAQVRWEAPAQACVDGSTARAILPDAPLRDEDVVVAPLGEAFRIVWVITNRYASGDGLGPVAVVEVRPRLLVVHAIGHLRANAVRPRLRLEKMGPAEVLVAEGEVCASADPSSCARSARLMPLVAGRYEAANVVDDKGRCVSPAFFHLGREEAEPLASGWRRRYRLDASLSFAAPGAVLHEEVVVHDVDPRHPNTPPRLFRRAEADAELRLEGSAFVSTGASLWARMLGAR
jgi:hypothetical protein